MALPSNFTPKAGNSRYTMSNLSSGETVKIRVMSDYITGKIVWSGHTQEEKKPFRVPEGVAIPTAKIGTNLRSGKPENIRQFVAAICWNYGTERLEIFETDKSTIIGQIFKFEQDEDYGDSKGYDLKISKSGQGMETEYSVVPSPPSKAKPEIVEALKSEPINLEALYTGDDPFNGENSDSAEHDSEDVASDVPF